MLDVILIDDEPKAIKSLEWEIDNYCEDVNVMETFTSPKKAVQYLEDREPDCVFLDIEMPEMDGFEFLDRFHQRNFHVVFITAYNQYAISAIKENAMDYLLKPIDSDDLVETVEKLRQDKSSQDALEKNLMENSKKRIAIPIDGKLIFLTVDEIIYCQSDGNYCKIFLTNGKFLFVSKKLKKIQDLLPDSSFYRVHNSYIVNLKKVREYLKTDGYVILENQKEIPVSRSRKSTFLNKI